MWAETVTALIGLLGATRLATLAVGAQGRARQGLQADLELLRALPHEVKSRAELLAYVEDATRAYVAQARGQGSAAALRRRAISLYFGSLTLLAVATIGLATGTRTGKSGTDVLLDFDSPHAWIIWVSVISAYVGMLWSLRVSAQGRLRRAEEKEEQADQGEGTRSEHPPPNA